MPELPEPLSHTVLAIWEAYEKNARQGDSRGINMGMVGEACTRKLWYILRWASPPEQTTGQKQRRFGTGNREEERLLDDLESAGVTVERLDPATGQQFRVELADGWLRGKLDAKGINVPEAPKATHVIECKSHNDKSFKDLVKKKLKDSKPDHYAQVQSYMHAEGLTRALYIAVNKNTDELYAERVEYDHIAAMQLVAKVERVVKADVAPPRLFDDPTSKAAYSCSWCPAKAQCHEGAFARQNCRTCISAELLPGAVVRCALLEKELSYDEQQRGCPSHVFLPSLVPGEQIDASEEDWTVTYKMKDGSTWVDGGEG